ncbi:hypothetical protein BH20ACT5_BH20ACT5_18100 [soil metagenome]
MPGPGSPWVELRIHGVSGTPPEAMLGSAHVRQVAGDEFGRFFRPCDAQGQVIRPAPEHIQEAYHWGKFNSGSWRQGLWLAILPFGFVNAAQFMLPRPVGRRATVAHAVAGAALRLLGLGLTAILVLGVAVVTLDLSAWQWAPRQSLPDWSAYPGWPLAAAMIGSAAVLGVLYSFGRQYADNTGPARGDSRGDGRSPAAAPGPAPDEPPTELGREDFFTGHTDAPVLRRLHLATGLTLIAVLGYEATRATSGWSPVARWLAFGLLAVMALVVAFLGDPERSATMPVAARVARRREQWHRHVVGKLSRVAVLLALLALAGSVAVAGQRALPGTPGRELPGIDGAAFVVLLGCVGAMLLLFAGTGLLAARTRPRGPAAPPRPFSRFAMGMTPALVAAVGTFLAVGYSAAMPFAWAWTLGRGGGPELVVSPLLQRIAYAWGLTFVVICGLVAAAVLSYLRRRSDFLDRARAAFGFGAATGGRLPGPWLIRVARAMWMARLKNQLELLFWTFALFGILLSTAAGLEFARSRGSADPAAGNLPGPLGVLSESRDPEGANLLIGIGTLVLIGLAAALVFLGRGAVRSAVLRRGVNVAWDVIAFWPRSAHPFVPPPYAQRAVADLRQRISWHLGAGEGGPGSAEPAAHVVVAAHSQGSLIALAALLWLPPEQRDRVGLVTFGSQLRVMYPRGFPAYVNIEVLDWIVARYGGRWRNLYRDTDGVAGPVLSWGHSPDGVGAVPQSYRIDDRVARRTDEIDPVTGRRICGPEWRLLDPTPYDLALQTGAVHRIRGHSDYPDDPDWPLAIAAVTPGPPGADAAIERAALASMPTSTGRPTSASTARPR